MELTKKNIENIKTWLKNNLDEERYKHTLGVASCAEELALKYDLNPKKAYIAGLMHDCAKCFSKDVSKSYFDKVDILEEEKINYKTWHAPIGAFIAKTEFGIDDDEILSAIRWHTLGKINMTLFEKIIFLADKIETETRDCEWCKCNRELLEQENGLNKTLLNCYRATLKSLCERNLKICKLTVDIYNNLLDNI
ncbi:bis(5'-nucleosyl)-tetraphosphatase (symmetrical) YqeK [bacterium]|nr:bis(5'-nucleosyl)-tetraphosphatase (symmetrical) YqeK [bacterium]